jgi:hypothetical protein
MWWDCPLLDASKGFHMRMPKLSVRRLMVTAAALSLLVSGLPGLTAGAAAATRPPDCEGWGWVDRDPTVGYGDPTYGTGGSTLTPVNVGPYAPCALVVEVSSTTPLHYHCFMKNTHGVKWTHLQVGGTNLVGWVFNGRLQGGGSTYPC